MAKFNNYNKLPNSTLFEIGPEATEIPRKSRMSHTGKYKTLYSNALFRSKWGKFWQNTVFNRQFEAFGVDLGVDLGRGHMFMAQRLLDQSDVPSLVVKPSCDGMPKRVRTDGFADPGLSHPTGHDPLHLSARYSASRRSGPQGFSLSFLNQGLQGFKCNRMQRNPVRVTALGRCESDHTSGEVNVLGVKSDGLTQTTAGKQQKSNNRPVSFSVPSGEFIPQNRPDFILGKYGWWQSSITTAFENGRRVASNNPPCASPGEQSLQADPEAIDGGLGSPGATGANLNALVGHESSERGRGDGIDGQSADKPCKNPKIPSVRRHRMRRAALLLKVLEKFSHGFFGSHGVLLCLCWWLVVIVHSRSWGNLYQGISDLFPVT